MRRSLVPVSSSLLFAVWLSACSPPVVVDDPADAGAPAPDAGEADAGEADAGAPIDQAPVIESATVTTPEDAAITFTLVASDPDGDALTIEPATPAHGTVALQGLALTYTPAADFHGEDTFDVTVTANGLTATAGVTVTVTPVNDPPVVPNAFRTIDEDTTLAIEAGELLAAASDVDGDTLAVTAVSGAELADGTITFAPAAHVYGPTSFTFTVSDGITSTDGTVDVDVTPVNDAPVAADLARTIDEDSALVLDVADLLAGAMDIDSETLVVAAVDGATLEGTTVTFTPAPDANGPMSFTFTVSDGVAISTGTVRVAVTPVNDAPVVGDAALTTAEDTALEVTAAELLALASDVDGDALSITAVSGATLDGTTITFRPEPNAHGPASFTFTVSDGHTATTATADVTVTPVNDPPVATAALATAIAGLPVEVRVQWTDVDSESVELVAVGAAGHGAAEVQDGTSLTYTSNVDFVGRDEFTFTVADDAGAVSTATVTVTVENPGLSSLRIESGGFDRSHRLTPAFSPLDLTYALDVGLSLASVRFFATAFDPAATVTIAAGATQPLPLNLGSNTFDLVVSTASGTSRTYSVTVEREAEAYAQWSYLEAGTPAAGAQFGRAVAMSGDTLVVGAPFEDGPATDGGAAPADAGAVHVFTRTNGAWTQQALLHAGTAAADDHFGLAVALEGDTLVVGAPDEDGGASQSGAAYVFTRTNGTWTQRALLKASNAGEGDRFGFSVALSADTLAVGAIGEAASVTGGAADDTAPAAGAAYVFTRAGGSWTEQAYLKASNAEAGDVFGASLALEGDTLAVGAPSEDSPNGSPGSNTQSEAGAVYVFTRTVGAWAQTALVKAPSAFQNDRFGRSVSLSGTTLAVGADGRNHIGAVNGGAAYVMLYLNGAWALQAVLTASNRGENDYFGYAVALSGDTLVVGARGEDSAGASDPLDDGAVDAGAAYVFTRIAGGGWNQRALLKASNAEAGDLFGTAVAVSGGTLVVTAPFEDAGVAGTPGDDGPSDAGAVYSFDF